MESLYSGRMADPALTSPNAVPTTLPDIIGKAGPLSQITILGDGNHADFAQSMLLLSPDVVRAAAHAGKHYMIIETLANPRMQDMFDRFYSGKLSVDGLRQELQPASSNMLTPAQNVQWREAVLHCFETMKENHVQLLPVDRQLLMPDGTGTPLPTERDHPEFVEFDRRMAAAQTSGDPKTIQAFNEWALKVKGQDFVDRYQHWREHEWSDQENARDFDVIHKAIDGVNGKGVLVVWGVDHLDKTNDLNEHLGKDRTRVISVFPSVGSPQITPDGESFMHELPDYIYYTNDGLGGRPDPLINLSRIEQGHIGAPSRTILQAAIASTGENSLIGTFMPGVTFPHVDVAPEHSAQLPMPAAPAQPVAAKAAPAAAR